MGSSTFNTGYQLAQDIASNSQAIATINSNLILGTLTTYESLADLKTAILNRASTMASGGIADIAFIIKNITEFPTGKRYGGTIVKYGANYLMLNIVSQDSEAVSIAYTGGNWYINVYAVKGTDDILKGHITNLQTKTLTIYKEQPIVIEVYRNASGANNYVRFVYSINEMVEVQRIGFGANDIVPSYSNHELSIVNNINGYVYYAIS